MSLLDDPYSGLVLIALALLIPFFLLATTSYIKFAVVLFLIRNALGVQQSPPNIALYAVALVLTAFTMTPVGDAMLSAGIDAQQSVSGDQLDDILTIGRAVLAPLEAFMRANTDPETHAAFVARAEILWPQGYLDTISTDTHILILVPSFMMSELTAAFQIGLLLFLPFIVIDLVVANVLTALGMMMVSPVTIALPLKLLLFVAIDGWFRLVEGLILSYSLGA